MSSRVTYKKDRIECEVGKELSLLEALQNEQNQLLQKLEKIRQEDNYGTYKNIVMALSEVTRLIEKESWKDMYSHYQLKDGDGEFQEVVSTWRQKGEDIKDHHIYKVIEDLSNKVTERLYFDVGRSNNDRTSLYYKNKVYSLSNAKYNQVVEKIKSITKNDNVQIYGDINGLGLGLADYLAEQGYIVNSTEIEFTDFKNNKFNIMKQSYEERIK